MPQIVAAVKLGLNMGTSMGRASGREAKIIRFSRLTALTGGERGIRTLDTGLSPYNALAGRRLRPLGHLSGNGFREGLRIVADTTPSAVTSPNGPAKEDDENLHGIQTPSLKPNARCRTRTASSMYFSSITTEILISEVEIISMLMPSSASVRNMLLAIPA